MQIQNQWLTHDLEVRQEIPKKDFSLCFNFSKFKPVPFYEEARSIAEEISRFGHFDLAFSGGIDSLFLLKLFHSMKLDFTPVIGITPANAEECSVALNECQKLGMVPKFIFLSEEECFEYFKEKVYGVCKSIGYKAAPRLIAADQAFEKGRRIVFGDNPFGKKSDLLIVEWDFYLDILYGKEENLQVPFFLYSQKMFYECIKALTENESYDIMRARLYGMKPQVKFGYHFSDHYMKEVDKLIATLPIGVNRTFTCSKKYMLNKLEKFADG